MIVCPKCSKENQDHYKFCLGCGSDLPRPAQGAASATATPPAGVAAAQPPQESAPTGPQPQTGGAAPQAAATQPAPPPTEEPAPQAAPAPSPQPAAAAGAAQPQGTTCPNCGTAVPAGFAFCGACGTPVSGGAPAKPVAAQPAAAPAGAVLILIQPDGSEGGMVEIPTSEVAVGRDAGGFFANDAYLSPRHAVLKAQGNKVLVRDVGSLNGVFKKILPNQPVEITSGDMFRMGQELVLFETLPAAQPAADGTQRMGAPLEGLWGRICLVVGKGRLGNCFPIGGEGIICGRERGNILFPEDGYISGVHLRIHAEAGKYYLTDLGSSNGTYLKLTKETALEDGDFILMGAQLFRVQI